MKLRMLGMVLVLALVPMAAEAQKDVPGEGRPSPIMRLTQAQIEKVIPLLQAEAGATSAFWWDQRATRGMTKQEYAAVKNALIAARLDAADAARLNALPSTTAAGPLGRRTWPCSGPTPRG